MIIGDIVMLNCTMLGEKYGSIGVCYEEYGSGGCSFIFTEGGYDGFSVEDQNDFLKKIGFLELNYNFKNVIRLTEDWRCGYFKKYFRYGSDIMEKDILKLNKYKFISRN